MHLSWTAPGYTGAIGFPITGYEYRVDSGGGYGAWTTVPGGAAATDATTTPAARATPSPRPAPTRCGRSTARVPATRAHRASRRRSPTAPRRRSPITAPSAGAYTRAGHDLHRHRRQRDRRRARRSSVTVWSAARTARAALLQTLNAPRTGTTWTVNSAALAYGAKSVCATPDRLGRQHRARAGPVNFTVGQVTDVVITNGGTPGRADKGDTVTVTFGQAMNPATLCTGWNGTTARSSTHASS